MKISVACVSLFLACTPVLAHAEEPAGPISVSGSATLISDYRFRGVSQTNKEMAIQGGFTVSHKSGLYVGTWASNLAGWGTFGGSNMELDLIAGYKIPVGDMTIDAGLTWYMYPGGADITDFAEPYVKLSGDFGPVNLLVGAAYAPKQRALGNVVVGVHPDAKPGDKEDNLYLWGDISGGIPQTPVTLKAHLGHSDGNPGLGPNATSIAPTGKYFDWSLGADVAVGPVTLGLAYVDTDISKAEAAALPGFSSTKDGSSISSGHVLVSATVGF